MPHKVTDTGVPPAELESKLLPTRTWTIRIKISRMESTPMSLTRPLAASPPGQNAEPYVKLLKYRVNSLSGYPVCRRTVSAITAKTSVAGIIGIESVRTDAVGAALLTDAEIIR